jgi:hypothetical protein
VYYANIHSNFEGKKSENYEEEIGKLNKILAKNKLEIENLKFDHGKVLEKNDELIVAPLFSPYSPFHSPFL